MTPLIFIIALYLEPVGKVTDEPYDFLTGVEEIPVIELEDIEMKLRQRELQERFRILENFDERD